MSYLSYQDSLVVKIFYELSELAPLPGWKYFLLSLFLLSVDSFYLFGCIFLSDSLFSLLILRKHSATKKVSILWIFLAKVFVLSSYCSCFKKSYKFSVMSFFF